MPSPYHREDAPNEEEKRPHPVSIEAGAEAIRDNRRRKEEAMAELFPDEKPPPRRPRRGNR